PTDSHHWPFSSLRGYGPFAGSLRRAGARRQLALSARRGCAADARKRCTRALRDPQTDLRPSAHLLGSDVANRETPSLPNQARAQAFDAEVDGARAPALVKIARDVRAAAAPGFEAAAAHGDGAILFLQRPLDHQHA